MRDNINADYIHDDDDRPEFGWRDGVMAIVLILGLALFVVALAGFQR